MNSSSLRVIISPLNWGLGHATRCIPVIRELQALQCEIIIGANGAAANILSREFPELKLIITPGKTIRYSQTRVGFAFAIFWQLPALWQQIRKEKKWLQQQVEIWQPNLIISDNRYGMYHSSVPSVLITHQLGIKTGWGKLADRMVQVLLYRLLKNFKEVWIPDFQGAYSIAGLLSHPIHTPPIPAYYIGLLNRFLLQQKTLSSIAEPTTSTESIWGTQKHPSLLILLSGPEPQRSILESILKIQIADYAGNVVLLRGLPENNVRDADHSGTHQALSLFYGEEKVQLIDHLAAADLLEKIKNADIILCRSGYTSLMELLPLQKKLILIPTPGQAEQEYLARYCEEKGYAISINQHSIQLNNLINKATKFPYQKLSLITDTKLTTLQERVHFYLRSLQ
jgi:UDP-N-acetylglucosamine transferase subunit ALG13